MPAYLGFGAYSFAIPLPIAPRCAVAAMTWQVAKPPVKKCASFQIGYLVGDSLTLADVAMMSLVGQGDYMVLGLARFPDTAIGTYVFAFNIALQPFRFIAPRVSSDIPSLSQVSLSREKIRDGACVAFADIGHRAGLRAYYSARRTIVPSVRGVAGRVPVLQIISVAVMVSSPCPCSWSSGGTKVSRVCLINGITFFGS